jgi:dipeptidyl aminopeptidase/acylaminoacyl peptidase
VVAIALVAVMSATGCMERLFYYPVQGRTDPPPHLAGAESVWFHSADGTRLHGWFIPATSSALVERIPTILHVHGNAGNIESHVGFTEYLPAAGFNLFIFDYRGYGQSDGRARRRGPLIADSQAALDALLARSDINTDRIGLYAQSLGGAIGLNLMAERPEIKAAVIESSFASWRDMAASAVGGDPPGPISRFLASILIGDDYRPVDAVARIDRPILLFHGTDDSVIPVSHSRRLAEAGPTTEFVEIAGGDHNTLRWTNPEVEQLTIDFFRKHLAAP